MITQEQIQQQAILYQSTERNIFREYLQHVFLSTLYAQPRSDGIFFKGGTALRIIYQSPRFSEDLDFSATTHSSKELEHILEETLIDIERLGLTPKIQEAKTTSGGYLADIGFSTTHHESTIELNISLRQQTKKGELVTIVNDFIPPYTLIRLSQDQLVKEKIQALLTRKKPRDFYDLYFIIRANLLPPQEKHMLVKVVNVVQSTTINFEHELKQFLPRSHWMVLKDFPSVLMKELQRFL